MLTKESHFDTQDSLEEKIDRLTTMMTKLTVQDDDQNKQFKPKIYQGKRRGQMRIFFMINVITTKEINVGIDQNP